MLVFSSFSQSGGGIRQYTTFSNGLNYKDNKKCRNIAAVLIVLHHGASIFFYNKYLIVVFNNIGHLVVGLFFLWSGWGLGLKTKKNDFEEYRKRFLRNNISPLFLYTFLFNAIKTIFYLVLIPFVKGEAVLINRVVRKLFFIGLPDATEWYFLVLIAIYCGYYIAESIFRKPNQKIFVYWAVTALYIALCWIKGVDGHWYISVISWAIGYTYAINCAYCQSFFDNHWKRKLFLTIIVWFLTWTGVVIAGRGSLNIDSILPMLFTLVSVISFDIAVTYADSIYKFGRLWRRIGDFSLGMYAIHPILLTVAGYLSDHGVLKLLAAAITFAILIPLSLFASRLFGKINKSLVAGKG